MKVAYSAIHYAAHTANKLSRSPVRYLLTGLAIAITAAPAMAVDPTVAGSTSIGKHPSYPTAYSGFWRNGFDYSLLTDGTNTFVNAPNANGIIYFRGANSDRMTLSKNYLNVKGAVAAIGIDAANPVDLPDSTPAISGIGVNSQGVAGESETDFGVFGESENNAAIGGYSVNSWSGMFGVDPHDDEARVKYGLYAYGYNAAAYFSGNVSINPHLAPPNDVLTTSTFTVNATSTFNGPVTLANTSLTLTGNGGSTGIATKPGSSVWIIGSDERAKKDIKDFKLGLADLEKIHPVKFKYNGLAGMPNNDEEYVGVVAQELEKTLPFMVVSEKKKLRESDEKPIDFKEVDAGAFTYMLINSVKELAGQNRELAAQNAEQNKKLAELTDQNKKLAEQDAKLNALAEQNKALVSLIEQRLGTTSVALFK
ncbi:MAG TPA: tail fiber domain-containing protein [Rhodocyclaceae bacterium]|nr:tail fiber domain-containing protein [Rhodocyclaceae bacterium]